MYFPQKYGLLVGASIIEAEQPTQIKIKRVLPWNPSDPFVRTSDKEKFIENHVSPDCKDIDCNIKKFAKQRFLYLLDIAETATYCINRTFHGIGGKHLQAYLDQYCYVMNHKTSGVSMFQQVASLCASYFSGTYLTLTRHLKPHLSKKLNFNYSKAIAS